MQKCILFGKSALFKRNMQKLINSNSSFQARENHVLPTCNKTHYIDINNSHNTYILIVQNKKNES